MSSLGLRQRGTAILETKVLATTAALAGTMLPVASASGKARREAMKPSKACPFATVFRVLTPVP